MKYRLGGRFLFVVSVFFFCMGIFLLYLISPVFAEEDDCTAKKQEIEKSLGIPEGQWEDMGILSIFQTNCETKTVEEIVGFMVEKISFHLTIDPLNFKAQEKIKTIVLNTVGTDKETYLRATKDGANKPVFEIGILSGSEYIVRNKVGNNGSSSIGGSGNKNEAGKDTAMVLGGELNELSGSDGLHSVIAGGTKNLIKGPNSIVFGTTNVSLLNDRTSESIALGVKDSQIKGGNSVALAGKDVIIESDATGSVAIGSNITINKPGIFAFNSKSTPLNGNVENSFLVNAKYGMIIGGNRSNLVNTGIQLVVKGAIKLGHHAGSGFCDSSTIGTLYSVDTDNKMLTCICSCGDGNESVAISNQPYCDPICKEGGGRIVDEGGFCGARGLSGGVESGMIYEYQETGWRPGTVYCSGLAFPMIENASGEWEVSQEVDFPAAGTGVKWGCPGLGNSTVNMVECYARRKDAPPECGANARTYAMTTTTWTGTTESDFCLTGSLMELTVKDVTYTANTETSIEDFLSHGVFPFPGTGEDNKATWICSSNTGVIDNEGHLRQDDIRCYAERRTCNRCAANGFPYCFNIDFLGTCQELDY